MNYYARALQANHLPQVYRSATKKSTMRRVLAVLGAACLCATSVAAVINAPPAEGAQGGAGQAQTNGAAAAAAGPAKKCKKAKLSCPTATPDVFILTDKVTKGETIGAKLLSSVFEAGKAKSGKGTFKTFGPPPAAVAGAGAQQGKFSMHVGAEV